MTKSPPRRRSPPSDERIVAYKQLLKEAVGLGIERRELPDECPPAVVEQYIASLMRAIQRRRDDSSPADVVTVEVLKSDEYQNFLDACLAKGLRFHNMTDAGKCLMAAARRFNQDFDLDTLAPSVFAVFTSKIEAGELTW